MTHVDYLLAKYSNQDLAIAKCKLTECMAERDRLAARLAAVGEAVGRHSCGCDCDHTDYGEEHDDDCERCLPCVLRDILERKK